MITEDKVTEIYCMADDFCKVFDAQMEKNLQKLIKNVGKDQIKAVMQAFSTLFGPLLAFLWTLGENFRKKKLLSIKIGSYQIET